MNLESILEWYQQRIGLYDKQSWETTVEQRILRGLSYSPRKTAKQKTDLIDVDLVRGSTFPKAKPQSDVWLAGLHGIFRLLLLPLYFKWWIKEATSFGFILVASMYCSVITSTSVYFTLHESNQIKIVPASEVLLPAALLILLSVILSQMASTRRKGIKVTFPRSRIARPVRSGRKSRSSRRNSLATGLKSFRKACNSTEDESSYSKENIKIIKSLDASYRSHSEDLHFGHTLDIENRSASENNLIFNLEKPDTKTGESAANEDDTNTRRSTSGLSQEEWETKNTPEDCKLRYRGIGAKGLYRGPASKCRMQGYSGSQCERSSEGYSDGEDGCHADIEGPTSDEEDRKDKRSRFKLLGPNGFMQKKPDPALLTVPKPFVMVQSDDNLPSASASSCESEDGENCDASLPTHFQSHKPLFGDWVGMTTNSAEDPSYSSESEGAWDDLEDTGPREPIDWHIQGAPAAVISSTTKDVDKGETSSLAYLASSCIGCKIWEESEMKKVDLSVLDISSAIISRVDSLHQSSNYLMFGLVMGGLLAIVPTLYRLLLIHGETADDAKELNHSYHQLQVEAPLITHIIGDNVWCFFLIGLNALNRLVLGSCFFFLLSVAERTFKQRFLYAKHFCYLTSARRARKYDLPHFRLNKVINIKSWLSIRSCLKKRGPQHSVDVIISATFIITLLLVFYLGVEALKDEEKALQPLHNCELFVWCFAVSIYLIRFMTLGALINKKYSNPSVLITEQINMYLHMEQNPQKKDNLTLANNVLKLVSVLLKELDSPFKISGLSANTLLYNITKFGILSACSGVLSNLLGFKLKLHNIKFR